MEFIVPFLTVSARGQSEETSKWNPWFTDWRYSEKRSGKFASFFQVFRSSRLEVFCKKGAVRNFAKYTGKHLCQSLFFNKALGLRPVTLLKKRLWRWCFSVSFAKFLRTPFHTERLWWLLLGITQFWYNNQCSK